VTLPQQFLSPMSIITTTNYKRPLDATYLPVLNQLLIGVTGSEKQDIIEQFKQVVGSIVILASPLSATSLNRLLGFPEGTVDSRINLLHSVLSISSDPNQCVKEIIKLINLIKNQIMII